MTPSVCVAESDTTWTHQQGWWSWECLLVCLYSGQLEGVSVYSQHLPCDRPLSFLFSIVLVDESAGLNSAMSVLLMETIASVLLYGSDSVCAAG